MLNFNEFYKNREKYKKEISTNIDYLLKLAADIPTSQYDISGDEDKLISILSLAAIKELKNKNMANFYYMITDNRFNDAINKELFIYFFKLNNKDNSENILISKVFEELLDSNFFNFSYIFRDNHRESYCGYIKENKERLNILITHLKKNKIYFYLLYKLFEGKKNENIKDYINKCKKNLYISEILHYHNDSVDFSIKEYAADYFDKNDKEKCLINYDKLYSLYKEIKRNGSKKKANFILKIFAIGFSLPYKTIIGGEKNYIKDESSITYYPDTLYYVTYPLYFNSPFENFTKCINSLDSATKINLTDIEKNKINEVFQEVYESIYFN